MWVNNLSFLSCLFALEIPPFRRIHLHSSESLRSLSSDPARLRKTEREKGEKCFDNKFSRRARVKGSHIYSSFAYSFLFLISLLVFSIILKGQKQLLA